MSMKAQELMIGDWVCLKDENLPLEERYFKIEYLAISAGVSWVNQGTNAPIGLGDGESLIPVFIDEIYPIPITPEILEKNGFEADSNNSRMLFHHDNYRLCYYFNSGNHFSSFNITNGSLVQKVIVNVHEIQHALKLCGIDKDIVV